MAATEGRGADAVLEVVGNQGAFDTALSIVRPYGAVSSVGVHAGELKIDGGLLYDKKRVLSFNEGGQMTGCRVTAAERGKVKRERRVHNMPMLMFLVVA